MESESIETFWIKNKKLAFDIKICEKYLAKKKAQIVHLQDEDFKSSKDLFTILGIPYFISPSEGETLCSQLALYGKVAGVLSEDTDILAYGTGIFLTKINTSQETVVEIRISNILDALSMSQAQFTDLCIMCGTDYNSNIFRVGPEKAFKLLEEFGSIEDIKGKDTTILNYKRVRELFAKDTTVCLDIPFCKSPDLESLKDFLFHNNCKMHVSTVVTAFQPKELQFIENEI